MRETIKAIAKKSHFFIYLLPLFFVLHGFTYSYNLVSIKTALLVLAAFLTAAFLLSRLSFLFFRDWYKAHLFTVSILFINFFFGNLYQGLNNISKKYFFGKYSFLFALSALLLVLLFILLKRKNKVSGKVGFAFNIFLFSLLLVEIVSLTIKLTTPNKFSLQLNTSILKTCHDCQKPDIYFILTDGYAGPAELKDLFGFDNSAFDSALAQRKFHVIRNSQSNYNYTVLSMASILNMSYLNLNRAHNDENRNVSGSLRAIKRSQLAGFMKMNGYKVCNNSIFQMDEGENEETFLFPGSLSLLMGSTLVYHVARIIQFKLHGNKNLQVISDGQLSTIMKSNALLYDKTIELASTPSTTPRFVYTHLLMPHFPYFFDKTGNKTSPETILYQNRFSKKDYLEYLQYVSMKVLALIDSIQKKSATPPVIILLSDHGFHQLDDKVDPKYYFSNISAVYLPKGDYSGFYDGMSNVNIFRTLLNTQFKQRMDILKDSTIFRKEQ
jgi:Sulfatase